MKVNLYRLHLGRIRGTKGRAVSDSAFANFLAAYVTPRFPGFTVLESAGHWERNAERSCVLEILAPESAEPWVREIADAYCRECRQDSVLWYGVPAGHTNLATLSERTQAA